MDSGSVSTLLRLSSADPLPKLPSAAKDSAANERFAGGSAESDWRLSARRVRLIARQRKRRPWVRLKAPNAERRRRLPGPRPPRAVWRTKGFAGAKSGARQRRYRRGSG